MIIGLLRLARRCRVWGLLRLAIAGLLLWVVATDTGPRLARLQFAALPDFDYAAEVSYLRAAGRFGEALLIADAGLEATVDPATLAGIEHERKRALAEQRSLLRGIRESGMGALSGRGDSLESLLGAVAADLFIVGDVRDLVLESGRFVLDGEADEVIVVLSALGIAATAAPYVNWAPAVLKISRRMGTLSRSLADHILHLARTGQRHELSGMMRDVQRLSEHATPGGAVRLLRHADSPEDLAALATFVERHRAGAAALHITGSEGANLVKQAARAGDRSSEAGQAIIMASRKGNHGAAWLRSGAWQGMLRPHPLIGLTKGLWKGNLQALAGRALSLIDQHFRWLLPLLAAWFSVELALQTTRLAAAMCSRRHDPGLTQCPRPVAR